MNALTATGALASAVAYAASTVFPVRGLHDRLVPGAVFRHERPSVALTFDDGPHPERTPAVLDLLAAAGARATFFVVGREVLRHRALARRIGREGHVLANHTFTHAWLPGRSTRAIEAELSDCQHAVADVVGEAPTLVRPPYGHRDARFYLVARQLGLTPVLWSVDALDYLGSHASAVLARASRAGPGDIVLMHDGNARARGTLPALARLCGALRGQGLALDVLEPLSSRAPTLEVAR